MQKAEETVEEVLVHLEAWYRDIQVLQHEPNTRDADIREAREEFLKDRIATERETTQLNRDKMRLRELQEER